MSTCLSATTSCMWQTVAYWVHLLYCHWVRHPAPDSCRIALKYHRAELCISADYAITRCPSVRPSHSGIVSKQLNISPHFFTLRQPRHCNFLVPNKDNNRTRTLNAVLFQFWFFSYRFFCFSYQFQLSYSYFLSFYYNYLFLNDSYSYFTSYFEEALFGKQALPGTCNWRQTLA